MNSPIDGIAGIAKTQVGDLVRPTTLLTTVSQLDPIKVTFPISEREYLHFAERIKQHQENGVAKNEPELEMILADGKHLQVSRSFLRRQSAGQRPDRHDHHPGNLSRIPTTSSVPVCTRKSASPPSTKRGALLVPQSAVLETQGQYQVAVVGADNRVSLRTVKTGKQAGALRIIEDGLAARRTRHHRGLAEGLRRDGSEAAADAG